MNTDKLTSNDFEGLKRVSEIVSEFVERIFGMVQKSKVAQRDLLASDIELAKSLKGIEDPNLLKSLTQRLSRI